MTYSRPARPIEPRTFGRLLAVLAAVLIFASPFTPQAQAQEQAFAPADQAAFDDLVVGKRMLIADFYYIDFISPGRYSHVAWSGSYSYEKTGSNTGTLTDTIDGFPDQGITSCLIFDSRTTGRFVECDGEDEGASWRLVDIPAVDPTAPADQAAFDGLVVGKRMLMADPDPGLNFVDFISPGRYSETSILRTLGTAIQGSYSYEKTGSNTGTVSLNYDSAFPGGEGSLRNCTVQFQFDSRTTGWLAYECSGWGPFIWPWQLIDIPGAPTTLYFPDYVDGGGWSVQLAVSNIDTTAAAAVVVTAYDKEGQPIPGFFDSEGTFGIPPLGTRILRSAGVGEIRRGWIEVRTETASVSGLLTYRQAGTGIEVSVEPVELGSHFALFVEESSDIGTGLAIFKPDSSPRIELRIRDEEGSDPLEGVFIPWGNFNHKTLTIPEWLDVDGVDTEFIKDFRGLLFLRSEDGSLFAPLGLRFEKRGRSLSAVPVIKGGDVTGGMRPSGTGDEPSSLAPADQDAFNEAVVGKRVLSDDPNYYIDFISPGRFKETEGSDVYPGSYTYRNTGSDTGTVTLNYDDGDRCTFQLTFATATSGSATFSCNDGTSGNTSWRLVNIPSDDDDEDTSTVCATGSTVQSGSECALQYPEGTPDAGLPFGRFAVGEQFGSEKGCLYIGSGFVNCGPNNVSSEGTLTAPSGNKYPLDFAASKIENSSSWRISKLSVMLQQ